MSSALRHPSMTREGFFAWAELQDTRYEFDGFEPVAMTGGSLNHSQMCQNLYAALRSRLRGGGCRLYGPDAGVATASNAVRYPNAVVTCTKAPGLEHVVRDPVVVFEVLSPGSGRVDRIVRIREYGAVESIRRYVILEYKSIGLTMFARADGQADWTATALTSGDTLPLPEIGVEVPVSEFYDDIELPNAPGR